MKVDNKYSARMKDKENEGQGHNHDFCGNITGIYLKYKHIIKIFLIGISINEFVTITEKSKISV